MLDDVQDVGGRLIVKGYRNVSAQWGCAPTSKTSDQKIIEIYSKVGTAFNEAEERRGEHIPALYLNRIVLHFLALYELCEPHFQQHLEYEVNKYLAEGLREDYKRELRIIDENSDEPDVKRVKELQATTREALERQFPEKANKSPTLPYAQIAETVLRFSVVAAGEFVEMAERASCMKTNAVTQQALLQEVVAYHLNVAIANVMVKSNLLGRDNYNNIEAGICSESENTITKLGTKLAIYYLPIIARENRHRAQMYFCKDGEGLEVSEQQIRAYAEKHNRTLLTDIPADQMALVYYIIRVSRLLTIGMDIDRAIVWGVNGRLLDRCFELQDEICKLLI
jgi:hypothetical protein